MILVHLVFHLFTGSCHPSNRDISHKNPRFAMTGACTSNIYPDHRRRKRRTALSQTRKTTHRRETAQISTVTCFHYLGWSGHHFLHHPTAVFPCLTNSSLHFYYYNRKVTAAAYSKISRRATPTVPLLATIIFYQYATLRPYIKLPRSPG